MSVLKILTDSGRKLADIYRTRGSVAGLDKLDVSNVVLTHDMGHEIAAERYAWEIYAQSTTVAQSTEFALGFTVPYDLFRLATVFICADSGDGGKFADIMVTVMNFNSVDTVVWAWDSVVGTYQKATNIKMNIAGSSADRDMFLPVYRANIENVVLPGRQSTSVAGATRDVRSIQVRGTTNAFGAGTAGITAQMGYGHMADLIYDNSRVILSAGLPLPK